MNKTIFLAGLVVIGILFLVAAYIYFTTQANLLPSFFPGHEVGLTKVHFKHGLGALILAAGCFILAWFQSAKKSVNQKK